MPSAVGQMQQRLRAAPAGPESASNAVSTLEDLEQLISKYTRKILKKARSNNEGGVDKYTKRLERLMQVRKALFETAGPKYLVGFTAFSAISSM
jgi:hypothetical protein